MQQISRATYSKIIWILKSKEITADLSIELADLICEEIEKTETIRAIPQVIPQNIPLQPTIKRNFANVGWIRDETEN